MIITVSRVPTQPCFWHPIGASQGLADMLLETKTVACVLRAGRAHAMLTYSVSRIIQAWLCHDTCVTSQPTPPPLSSSFPSSDLAVSEPATCGIYQHPPAYTCYAFKQGQRSRHDVCTQRTWFMIRDQSSWSTATINKSLTPFQREQASDRLGC